MGASQSTPLPSQPEQRSAATTSSPTPSDLLNQKSSPLSTKASASSQIAQGSSPIPTARPTPQEIESFEIRAYKPVPLTAGQEQQVRDVYYKNVRAKCTDEIREMYFQLQLSFDEYLTISTERNANEISEFAKCAKGRTVTIPFACRTERRAMESCMISYATREEEDKAREEWFSGVGQRRRDKANDEAWKEDQRKKKAEWWNDYKEGKQ